MRTWEPMHDSLPDVYPAVVRTGQADTTLWISWERHRRSRELADAFDARLVEIVSSRSRPWKYLALLATTIRVLLRARPSTVFVQCPSVVLGTLTGLLRPLLGYRLILDLHNECVQPYNYEGRIYRQVLRAMRRSADVLIVSNEALRPTVDGEGPIVCVLPDRLPSLPRTIGPLRPAPLAVFVCTYAPDEPYREVIEAARLLPGIDLYVTGSYIRAKGLPADLPANVTLCGFLPETDYLALLNRADVLVDLTSMENCLVCGAYEAVALEKPLVTSDTRALRAYFRRGTVFAGHTPEALAAAIRAALDTQDVLREEMRCLRRELDHSWQCDFAALAAIVGKRA